MTAFEGTGYELIYKCAPSPELFGKAISLDLCLLATDPGNEEYQISLDRVMARLSKLVTETMLRREYTLLRRYGAILEQCSGDVNLQVQQMDCRERARVTLKVLGKILGVASSGWSLESDLTFFERGAEFGEFHKKIFSCLATCKEDEYLNFQELCSLLPPHENEKLWTALRDMSSFIHRRSETCWIFKYKLNRRGRRVWEAVVAQQLG